MRTRCNSKPLEFEGHCSRRRQLGGEETHFSFRFSSCPFVVLADSSNDPLRACGFPGIQGSRFLKNILSILSSDVNQRFTHGRRRIQTPHRGFRPSGRPRRGRSIEKDQKLNMDAQDAQDNQDGTLLHAELTPAMIRFGFADAQE